MILKNEKNVKKESVAVNNGHALKALTHEMWKCAAADLSALKGLGDVSQTRFSSVSVRSGKRQKTHRGPLMPSLPSTFSPNRVYKPKLWLDKFVNFFGRCYRLRA